MIWPSMPNSARRRRFNTGAKPSAPGASLRSSSNRRIYIARYEFAGRPTRCSLIIILTDGAGNVSLTGLPAQEEVWQVPNLLRQSHLRTIVLNMEDPTHDIGLPYKLANALGGPCYTLAELNSATLVQTVREETRIAGT